MRVQATKKGIYNGERNPGEVFEFPEALLKKDAKGNTVFPSWFVSAEKPAAKKAEKPTGPKAPEGNADDIV